MEIGTWSLVDLPDDRTAIGSRWVYVRTTLEGLFELAKARVVAQELSVLCSPPPTYTIMRSNLITVLSYYVHFPDDRRYTNRWYISVGCRFNVANNCSV